MKEDGPVRGNCPTRSADSKNIPREVRIAQWDVTVNPCNEIEVTTDLLLSMIQRLDHRSMFQHDLTRRYSPLTSRTHLPEWIRQLGRLGKIDGHPEEIKRSEQWITDPCLRLLRESDLTVRPLEHQLRPHGEKLYLTTRVITLPQLRQQNLCQIVQRDSILRFIVADNLDKWST